MANILLGITGSVAAIKTRELLQALLDDGHLVKVVATNPALYFLDRNSLPAGTLFTDADEWPQGNAVWNRNDPVLHIELRRWAEILLIAPLDANTLAKLAVGLCDNCLTCVYRAWNPQRPILLAPAMNTFMWEHPLTSQHLRRVARQFGLRAGKRISADDLVVKINRQQSQRLRFVGPISKQLACGDIGQGAMAEIPAIVHVVAELVGQVEVP
ncbi:MAG TPA: flavoprotein [Gemmatales bacterium]|nr:flavoprotein [Gemmatales bacterium]HMP15949.1 flavoprotein [Gemmatales bacterium]